MKRFKTSAMLLCSKVEVVVLRGIDRTDVVIPVVYFSKQGTARPGRAFL